MQLFYTFIIQAYALAVRFATIFNQKAASMVKGHYEMLAKLAQEHQLKQNWIWFHAASLGEFEQGRPLIESVKKRWPEYKILLTFFSPSGYEVRKDYPLADDVSYLPFDTVENAKRFITAYSPRMAVFIKYEFWFNYMSYLHKKNIPLVFVSARFRPDQLFFRWYGKWFLNHLKRVNHFFVQDENSKSLLQTFEINQVSNAGDTRFDRVFRLAKQAKRFPEIEAFIGDRKAIVIGSSWPEDEQLLFEVLKNIPETYCFIIAPHDVNKKHISQIIKKLPFESLSFSSLLPDQTARVLIIDTIGMLSQLYQYGHFAYVGGGFGSSIHNIQEPIAFGCPVIIGPHYKKFNEAIELIQLGGVFTVANKHEMKRTFDDLVIDGQLRNRASEICKAYAEKNIGATEKIIDSISNYLKIIHLEN